MKSWDELTEAEKSKFNERAARLGYEKDGYTDEEFYEYVLSRLRRFQWGPGDITIE